MNWALAALELDTDADERAIKRAYARLLRSNRPDDDPAAFQQLHEAYQTALQWYRHRQEELQADVAAPHAWPAATEANIDSGWPMEAGAASSPGGPAPHGNAARQHEARGEPVNANASTPSEHRPAHAATLQQPTPPVDVDAVVSRIAEAAHSLPADAFARWLRACPELWSLADREAIAHNLAIRLFNHDDEAISAENFNLISDSFGWNEINGPIDIDALTRLRSTLHARWLLLKENETALLARLRHISHGGVTLAEARKRRHLLTRPWRRGSALFSALDPSRVDAMKTTLDALAPDGQPLPCPPLQPEQVQFWREVGNNQKMTRARLQVGLLRGACFALLWLLLPLAVYVIDASSAWRNGEPLPAPGAMLAMGGVGALLCLAIGIGALPWKLLLSRLLSVFVLPIFVSVLAVTALALIHFSSIEFLGTFLGSAALWLAVVRVFQEVPLVVRFAPLLMFGLYILAPMVLPTGTKLPYGQSAALLAVALAGYELLRLRHLRRAR